MGLQARSRKGEGGREEDKRKREGGKAEGA